MLVVLKKLFARFGDGGEELIDLAGPFSVILLPDERCSRCRKIIDENDIAEQRLARAAKFGEISG